MSQRCDSNTNIRAMYSVCVYITHFTFITHFYTLWNKNKPQYLQPSGFLILIQMADELRHMNFLLV